MATVYINGDNASVIPAKLGYRDRMYDLATSEFPAMD